MELRQKAKIYWIRLGDGNNVFFHASIKTKQKQNFIKRLTKKDGTDIVESEQLEAEIRWFYGTLMGRAEESLEEVNYALMREGAQSSHEERDSLIILVTDKEIRDALSRIGDNKTHDI